MEPYYDHAGITIFCGDCREILPQLPKVDLVLTDPKYGHADKWKGGTWATNPMYGDALRWDREPADEELIGLVLMAGNSIIIWGGNYYSLPPSRC